MKSTRTELLIGTGFIKNGPVSRNLFAFKVGGWFVKISGFVGFVGRIINRIIRSAVLYGYGGVLAPNNPT